MMKSTKILLRVLSLAALAVLTVGALWLFLRSPQMPGQSPREVNTRLFQELRPTPEQYQEFVARYGALLTEEEYLSLGGICMNTGGSRSAELCILNTIHGGPHDGQRVLVVLCELVEEGAYAIKSVELLD